MDDSLKRFNADSPLVNTKRVNSFTEFFSLLDSVKNLNSQALFPKVVIHSNMSMPEKFDLMDCFSNNLKSSSIVSRFGEFLDEINKIAK